MIRAGAIATTSRYAVVTGSCLVMHNAIMIAADRAGLTLLQAAVTSFCIMVVTGYLLLCAFVFRGTRSWRGFARYTAAMAANFPISTGLAWLFLVPLHQPMVIAAPAATLIMVVVNYVASHWAILGSRASRSLGA
ncbi:GtrA family protein [Sphingomonas sp. RT2P30]|uniref:GtrA family protein n=1 Tax=Parasphingomonas halimpatiens TaxID=3096162 RepID=UPI002FC7ACB9